MNRNELIQVKLGLHSNNRLCSINAKKSLSHSFSPLKKAVIAMSIALGSGSAWAIDCGILNGQTAPVSCQASGADEDALVDIAGTNNITTTSNPGVSVIATGTGKATLGTSGTLSIDADNTQAIYIESGNEGTSTLDMSGTTTITLGASGAAGIRLNSVKGAVVKLTGVFNLTNNSTQSDANGIEIDSSSTTDRGNISLTHSGEGLISAQNGNAIDIKNTAVQGDSIIELDLARRGSGIILAANGDQNSGISVYHGVNNTAGNIKISTNAAIGTNGQNASGILADAVGDRTNASATGGLIEIVNGGNITSNAQGNAGLLSHGIATLNKNADTSIYNNGKIITNGDDASGIRAEQAVSSVSGDIAVTTGANSNIETNAQNADGIHVNMGSEQDGSTTGNSGSLSVTAEGSIYTTGDGNANGIFASIADGGNSGDISVLFKGETIETTGAGANQGIYARQDGAGSLTLTHSGQLIKTAGDGAHGMSALTGVSGTTASGDVSITSTGTITTLGNGANGIFIDAQNDVNSLRVNNQGQIDINGANAAGIASVASGANSTIDIVNTGDITTSGYDESKGIYALNNGSGNTLVQSIGANITTSNVGLANNGIEAIAQSGTARIAFSNGTVEVSGQSMGLYAGAGTGGAATSRAEIIVENSLIDGSKSFAGSAVSASGVNSSSVMIDGNSQVVGGWKSAGGIASAVSLAGATASLINNGTISAMSDLALIGSATGPATHTIDNAGTIEGYFTFGSADTTFTNNALASWTIRNFANTTGSGGVRDTKAVAISDFGSGNNTVKNEAGAAIYLAAIDDTSVLTVDTTNQYVTSGALTLNDAGIVQGQLLNLNLFENRGTIDLSNNGAAGDILVISGASNSLDIGTGNGRFLADGGLIILDTVLNEGGVNSLSDLLVLENVEAGSSPTLIAINHVAGLGAVTQGDGIKVIEVLGTADSGSFALNNVVKGGIYEYTLHEGSITTAGDNSLYLRADASQINPDIGSYLANQHAATGLFMHSLHDRLGEPQLYQNYRAEGDRVPAVWIRAVASHTKNQAAGGALRQHSQGSLVHIGGEVADWTSNGNNRYHLGVMGAYGRIETRTTGYVTGSQVNSKIDGYGVGAYLTWYSDPSTLEGWYTDLWSMYNWFNNSTDGSDDYDSRSWTNSIEAGYASKLESMENYDWMLEPQVQIAYNHYSVDKIKDHNGLNVADSHANGVATRLGVRTYLRPSAFRNGAQPFVEANWLYNSAKNSMFFNGNEISDDTPKNRFEAKVGVQGEITKNVQMYSYIGLQWGQHSYEYAEGQVGIRYRF